MRKWIYSVVTGPDANGDGLIDWLQKPTLAEWLNEMGEQGWELVHLDHGGLKGLKAMTRPNRWVGVFKRQGGEVERV